MSVQSATLAGRRAAEARMLSTATIRRATGETAQDEGTGLEGTAWTDVHTDIRMRLVGGDTRRVEIGGVEFQQATSRADFPADTTDLADGDLIEVTAGEWAGAVFEIVEAVKGDQHTARRVPVREADRPEEWA